MDGVTARHSQGPPQLGLRLGLGSTPHSYRLPIDSPLEERGGRRGSPMVQMASSATLSYRLLGLGLGLGLVGS